MFPFTYVQLKGSRLKKKNDKSKHSEHCWTKPMFSFLTLCCKKDSLQWFSELAASQWLLLLLAQGFAGALGTPRAGGHPRATAGHSRSYFRSCLSGSDLRLYPLQLLVVAERALSFLLDAALCVQVTKQHAVLSSFPASYIRRIQITAPS